MADEKPIQELQPNWHHRDAESLEGQVTIIWDELDENGVVIAQPRPLVRIAFTRKGKSAKKCTGHLELQMPEGAEALIGAVPMLYGREGLPLRKRGSLLVGAGWMTEDCDQIFQNADGMPWEDVFPTLPPPVEEKTPPPEVD